MPAKATVHRFCCIDVAPTASFPAKQASLYSGVAKAREVVSFVTGAPYTFRPRQEEGRVTGSISDTEFAFGRVIIQTSARQLLVDGAPAKLGARAFDVLLTLVERRDRGRLAGIGGPRG
jgi:hypothetical protein